MSLVRSRAAAALSSPKFSGQGHHSSCVSLAPAETLTLPVSVTHYVMHVSDRFTNKKMFLFAKNASATP